MSARRKESRKAKQKKEGRIKDLYSDSMTLTGSSQRMQRVESRASLEFWPRGSNSAWIVCRRIDHCKDLTVTPNGKSGLKDFIVKSCTLCNNYSHFKKQLLTCYLALGETGWLIIGNQEIWKLGVIWFLQSINTGVPRSTPFSSGHSIYEIRLENVLKA